MLSAGSRVGPFEVVASLGAGGMGEVYRARDPRLEREVALKVLPAETLSDDTARARMLREARMAARLNHPNVCTIHEAGEADGQVYIAMELVQGRTLSSLLAAGGLPTEQALRYGMQVASALAHAHECGIVHRDLKSANVVITPGGHAKVLDFGLAKPIADEALAEATTRDEPTLTGPGALAGTLAYMAPEQLRGRPADARSDIWALGVVLYEMLGGRRPFAAQTGYELSAAILNETPRPLPESVPPSLRSLVKRCLAKPPGERLQRAEAVRAALETIESGGVVPGLVVRGRPRRAWLTAAAAITAVVAVLALLELGGLRHQRQDNGGGAIRMAVLPFANLSGDPEQEYLSDGLTQEMIAQLGRLHPDSLSVIARTSVMRYKNADTPIDRVGRELDVQYVLEGSAQREGSRVRITAELIRVSNQTQLWADSFEREMSGILALQADVARRVADSLALKLLPREQTRLADARPVNPEAYEAYLKGSNQWMEFVTPADLESAEQHFDEALEKDPLYAPAYSGRAWVWLVRSQFGWSSPEVAGPKAKAAALRAIELDESSASAHEALALVRAFVDWDWDGAWEPWRKSLEINPNVASRQGAYAHFLMDMGHGEEALIHGERAVVLDPFNPLVRSWYAFILYSQRRYDEAIAEAREALRCQPDFPVATNVLWWTLHEKEGKENEALEAARVFARTTYDDPRIDAALSEGYAQGGYAEAMRRGAEALIARLPETFCLPSDIAMFYMMAGEKTKALDWLEKGLKIHDPMLPYLGYPRYPLFEPLRSEPRFQALLRQVDLPLVR